MIRNGNRKNGRKTAGVAISAVLLLLLFMAATVPTASADPGWDYYRAIEIDHNKVSGSVDLNSFPVLISLTENWLKHSDYGGNVKEEHGYDIVFTDEYNTTLLDYEIEKYNGTAGTLVAWVRIPTFYGSANTTIRLWYGNPAATDWSNPTGVWDTNYKSVWHLLGGGTTTLPDATSYSNTGTKRAEGEPANTSSGKIGGAQDFDGSNDYVDLPASSSILTDSPFTISAWIITSVQQGAYGNEGRIVNLHRLSGGSASTGAAIYAGGPSGGGSRDSICFLYCSIDAGSHKWLCYQTSSPVYWDGNGHLITATHDGSTAKLYYDGVEVATESNTYGTFGTTKAKIGSYDGGARFFEGTIDEVMISDTVRSGDWIKTEYNNQNSPATFYSVDATATGTGGTDPVPELPTAILFAVGLVVLAGYIWLRRKNK